MADRGTLYDRVGGEPFFVALVDEFYTGVAGDEPLATLYPEHPDFSGARTRLRQFLVQYWGGPTTYSDQRGHPRLRMRHLPFHIGADERDRWLRHMATAVRTATERATADGTLSTGDAEQVAAELLAYFVPTAEHLRNDTGLPITSSNVRASIVAVEARRAADHEQRPR